MGARKPEAILQKNEPFLWTAEGKENMNPSKMP